jgi:hypothetical protein
MKLVSQETYNEGLNWYLELEKRLGLAKDDKELIKELKKQKPKK